MEGRGAAPSRRSAALPQRRVLVGLGDPLLERALLTALREQGDLAVERTLTGGQLLARAQESGADAALVAIDLPQVTSGILADLRRLGIPALILAPDHAAERWSGCGIVLPPDAAPDQVRAALDAALRGEGPIGQPTMPPHAPSERPGTPSNGPALTVIAVASGAGSPGRTTVALGLAAALGVVAPTILVDADLAGPSLAAHLDADPTRNLFMLAHSDPRTPGDWDRALEQEVQPLDPRSPHAAVLCGVPKPAMRAEVTLPLFERAVAELRARFRYVIVDVGADLLGVEATIHRAALGLADQVLLVGSADLVGLSRLRVARDLCSAHLALDPARLALVVNQYDRRLHHRLAEIEWALGTPLTALVPHDHVAIQRALAEQRPVTLAGRCRSGRALIALAERVHAGRITPLPDARGRAPWWHRAAPGERALAASRGKGASPASLARPRRRWTLPWHRRVPTAAPPQTPEPSGARPRAATVAAGVRTSERKRGRARGRA